MLPKLHLAPNHVSFLLKQFALVVGISPSRTVQRTLELTLTKAPVLCPHGCQGSDRNTNNNRSNSKGNFSLGERIRWKHSKKWIRSTIWNNCFHASWIPPYMCNDVQIKGSRSPAVSQGLRIQDGTLKRPRTHPHRAPLSKSSNSPLRERQNPVCLKQKDFMHI